MVKRSLAFFLCVLLMFSITGCGDSAKKNKEQGLGRYIEQDLIIDNMLHDGEFFAVQHQDGLLEIFAIGEEEISSYKQKEDLSFEEHSLPWSEAFNKMLEEEKYPYSMGMDNQGQIYWVMVGPEKEYIGKEFDPQHHHTYIEKVVEDKMVETQLNITGELGYILPSQIEVLENGDCILESNNRGIWQYSLETGNLVKTYSTDEMGSVCLVGDKLYVINEEHKGIDIYSTATGQVESQIACDKIDAQTRILNTDKGLYVVGSQGIFHQSEGGYLWEQVMESEGVSLGLPTSYVKNAFYQNERFVVMLINQQYQPSFKNYVYSDSTPSQPEVEISAYTLEANDTLREAAVYYEMAHPEVRIHVIQGMSEESGVTREDAIKALNTELLAGGGPDLLILDGLDLTTYIDKNILMNLDESKILDDVMPKIKDAFKLEKGTYAMPLGFTVPCILGEQSILDEVEDFESLVSYQKAHSEHPVLVNLGNEALYHYLAPFVSNNWMSETGAFNREKVGNFLEGIQVLTNGYNKEEQIGKLSSISQNYGLVYQDISLGILPIENVWDLLFTSSMATAMKEQGKDASMKLMKQDEKAYFIPHMMVGINQKTKQPEILKEIIRYMLSETAQMTDTGRGLPTNQKAYEKWLQGDSIDKNSMMGIGDDTHELTASWNGDKQMIPIFEEEVKEIEVSVMGDTALEQIVFGEAEAYFSGEKSLEEVLDSIEPKAELYYQG